MRSGPEQNLLGGDVDAGGTKTAGVAFRVVLSDGPAAVLVRAIGAFRPFILKHHIARRAVAGGRARVPGWLTALLFRLFRRSRYIV